jgi:transcriptional regulator of acetoin/glycerol metabolism
MPKAKTVDDLDFEMDDDGELNLSGFEEGDEFDFDAKEDSEEIDEEDSDEKDEGEEEDDEEEEVEDDEEESSDLTVESLREEFTTFQKNLPNVIAQSVAMSLAAIGLTGKKKKDEDDEEEEEEEGEISTKTLLKRLEKKIDTSVEAAVNGKMGKYQAAMDEADITRQFRTGAGKYGAAFVKAMPQLAVIMRDAELRGEDAAEKAWKIYRRLNPQQRDKLKVDIQKKQKSIARKKPDADSGDVVTKAPERTPFKKFKGNDSDVFDKSFDSSIVSHMKRRK